MQLSKEAVEHFLRLYKAEFGETLSDEAEECALRVLRLYEILLGGEGQ